MKLLKKSPVFGLMLVNALVFGFLISAQPVVADDPVDACDENVVDGYDCIENPPPFLPPGCYDNLGTILICENGEDCDT